MRRALVLGLVVLAMAGAIADAAAAPLNTPLRGTVASSWISIRPGGKAVRRVPVSAAAVYANFTWARVPTPGQPLTITFVTPTGRVAAFWSSRTVRSDRPGTRLWTRMTRSVYGGVPGRWHAILRVDDIPRGNAPFAVAG
jgi:hypothetical protein